MPTLAISAHGIPQVQGNHRIAGGLRPKIRDANPDLPAWRDTVTYAARAERIRQRVGTITGPVWLEVMFWLHRPASMPRTLDVWPISRGGGDWDKLSRAIGDSLVDALVMHDDSQIVDAHVVKRFAVGRDLPKIYRAGFHWEKPGVQILVREVGELA